MRKTTLVAGEFFRLRISRQVPDPFKILPVKSGYVPIVNDEHIFIVTFLGIG
jgi:hypothetical protein